MNQKRILDYFYQNISSLFWSFFILIGGGVFVLYYAHIGYMPEFDLKSAIAILGAASITATFTLLLFIIVFVLPSVFWTEGWANSSRIKNKLEDEDGNKNIFRTSIWFGIPILFYYSFFALITLEWRLAVIYGVLMLLAGLMPFRKMSSLEGKILAQEFFHFLGISFISSVLAIFPVYVLYTMFSSTQITSKGDPLILGIGAAAFVAFINIAVISKPKNANRFIYYIALGFLAFFIVFSSFEKFHRIPERTMEIYKFGSIKTESIVFDSDGCKLLKELSLLKSYQEDAFCSVKKAKILSRLGKNMYIEIDDRHFIVGSRHVVSWSVSK